MNIKNIESVVKILPTKKRPGTDGEFYQICKEELTSTHLKLFRNIKDEGILPDTSKLNLSWCQSLKKTLQEKKTTGKHP